MIAINLCVPVLISIDLICIHLSKTVYRGLPKSNRCYYFLILHHTKENFLYRSYAVISIKSSKIIEKAGKILCIKSG